MGVRYDYFGRYVISRKTRRTRPESSTSMVCSTRIQLRAAASARHIDDDDKGINLGPRIGFAYNVDGGGTYRHQRRMGHHVPAVRTSEFEPSIGNVPPTRSLTYSVQEAGRRGSAGRPTATTSAATRCCRRRPPIVGLLIDRHLQAPSRWSIPWASSARCRATPDARHVQRTACQAIDFSLYDYDNQLDRVTGLRPNPKLEQAQLLG